jgi:flagellar biosynthesis GTPase FlhF
LYEQIKYGMFQPAPTLDKLRINNLPPNLTSFVGRERDLAEINNLVEDPACRLLTLIGPGGVGKTRL